MLFVYQVVNSEGTWVQLDKNSVVEFCESDEGEAWSLARDRGGNQYLRHDDGKPHSMGDIFQSQNVINCKVIKFNMLL